MGARFDSYVFCPPHRGKEGSFTVARQRASSFTHLLRFFQRDSTCRIPSLSSQSLAVRVLTVSGPTFLLEKSSQPCQRCILIREHLCGDDRMINIQEKIGNDLTDW